MGYADIKSFVTRNNDEAKKQRQGIGSALIGDLLASTAQPVLVGTWAAAVWAIGFYQKHGFDLASEVEKDRLLRLYWRIPERQIETSVVLVKGL